MTRLGQRDKPFAGNQTALEALFLQEIHDGSSGLPLILVLAGLSDTEAKARDMHLTRGQKVHEAKPLTEAEARDFMRRLALWFGLDTSLHNPHLEALADICDGWPRHLRFAGVSLANEALCVDGDMHRMDWPGMRKKAWSLRQEYYRGQCSTDMKETRRLVAAVMKDIPGSEEGKAAGLDRVDVLDLIDLHRDHDGSRSNGWRLPESMTSRKFLNILIHQGALYEDRSGYIHSPIPSFRAYLIERGDHPGMELDRRNDDGDDRTDFRY